MGCKISFLIIKKLIVYKHHYKFYVQIHWYLLIRTPSIKSVSPNLSFEMLFEILSFLISALRCFLSAAASIKYFCFVSPNVDHLPLLSFTVSKGEKNRTNICLPFITILIQRYLEVIRLNETFQVENEWNQFFRWHKVSVFFLLNSVIWNMA